MKLLRWAMAGASAYVIYKYAIGNKATGEKVFDSPDIDKKPAPPPPPPAKAAKPAKLKAAKPRKPKAPAAG